MKVEIYANYALLAHEKEIVYALAPAAIHDKLTVEVLNAEVNDWGIVLVDLDGETYDLRDVLTNANTRGIGGKTANRPVMRWWTPERGHQQRALEVVS